MMIQKCPTCGAYETPQPVSEKVYDTCHADYSCDGCVASMQRPYWLKREEKEV